MEFTDDFRSSRTANLSDELRYPVWLIAQRSGPVTERTRTRTAHGEEHWANMGAKLQPSILHLIKQPTNWHNALSDYVPKDNALRSRLYRSTIPILLVCIQHVVCMCVCVWNPCGS